MEYFDVLNENGNKTGEVKLRGEVHRDGDWHKAVRIWVINDDGELIMQKRSSKRESNPNMWIETTSGHIDAGDTSINAAVRELKEEIGLDVQEEELEYLFTVKESSIHNGNFIDNEFVDIYLLNKDVDISILVLQEEEVSGIRKIQYKELEKMVDNNDKTIVNHKDMYSNLFRVLRQRDN